MDGALQVVDAEIGALEQQQAELLRQLGLVQQQISAAQTKRVSPTCNPLCLHDPLPEDDLTRVNLWKTFNH